MKRDLQTTESLRARNLATNLHHGVEPQRDERAFHPVVEIQAALVRMEPLMESKIPVLPSLHANMCESNFALISSSMTTGQNRGAPGSPVAHTLRLLRIGFEQRFPELLWHRLVPRTVAATTGRGMPRRSKL